MEKKLVIIDDDEVSLGVIESIFSDLYEVTCFTSPEAAIEFLQCNQVDCVLSDLEMPVIDGFEVIQQMKSIDDLTPIIIVSKYGDRENIRKSWELGAFDFIFKPFDKKFIQDVVRMAVSVGRSFNAIPANSDNRFFRKVAPISPCTFDAEHLEDLLSGHKSDIPKVLQLFLRQLEDFVQEIGSPKFLEDMNQVSRVFHKIHGASQNIFANSFATTMGMLRENIKAGGSVTEHDLEVIQRKARMLRARLESYVSKGQQELNET